LHYLHYLGMDVLGGRGAGEGGMTNDEILALTRR
jgi:hypothetical protein